MTESVPKRHPKKPRILGTKALKATARRLGLPVRAFARSVAASNDNNELAPVAQLWLSNKSRATGRKPTPTRVIPISKSQLEAARVAVRKLWGPPPRRGVAVVGKKKAA